MGCMKHWSVPGANSTHAADACSPSGAQQLKKIKKTHTHHTHEHTRTHTDMRAYTRRRITHSTQPRTIAPSPNHPIDVVGGETMTASILRAGQSIVSPRANASSERAHSPNPARASTVTRNQHGPKQPCIPLCMCTHHNCPAMINNYTFPRNSRRE